MSQAAADPPPPKASKLPLLGGLALALALGGGGFYATYSGMVLPAPAPEAALPAPGQPGPAAPGSSYLPVDAITINLGQRGPARHLRFVSQLEVAPAHLAEVTRLMPRIVDVLNTYLRALDPPELEEPAALTRIRGQMLRRIQIVAGPGAVSDLLIMEFVFN